MIFQSGMRWIMSNFKRCARQDGESLSKWGEVSNE